MHARPDRGRIRATMVGMPMLYFFNIIEGSVEIPDPEGTDLPSWEAAQAEGAAVAKELCQEFPGRFGSSSVLEVVTACGRRVMALPIGGH
jgi:hypothetical protein